MFVANPNFLFVALAKVCFFHMVINRAKIPLYLIVGKFLKKPEFSDQACVSRKPRNFSGRFRA